MRRWPWVVQRREPLAERPASDKALLLLFWRALCADPRRVGAVLPSSGALVQAVLEQTLAESPGHVIEIGAGTGAITQALVQHRNAFASLNVMERDARLAEGLRRRFPGTAVHACCASRLDELHPAPIDRLTLVSSIPFASLLPADRSRLLTALVRQTARASHWRLLQYSYGTRQPFQPALPAHAWTQLQTVWRNIPPARLWQLAAAAPGASGELAAAHPPSARTGR